MNIAFIKTKESKIIVGILFGFAVASIFRSACYGRKCIIYKAPEKEKIVNQIHKYEDKCYTYSPIDEPCA